jgi:NADH dehydrogenase
MAARSHRLSDEAADGRHHVVIVGGGFGGLALARGLGGTEVRVTLIDRRNYHLFQPLLYQVATAVLSPGEIAQPIRGILSRSKNVSVVMAPVERVDPATKEVHVAGRRVPYDTLVLATGATHSYFGHDEWARFAPGIKTLDDARRVRMSILRAFEQAEIEDDPEQRERLMTFAVIGGGPTGVEMAGAIAGLSRQALAQDFRRIDPSKARVLLIEAAPRLLGQFPEDLSTYAEQSLRELGVEVLTGQAVEKIDGQGLTVGGRPIPAASIVWAAGVRASPLGQSLHVETDRAGRVIVSPDLSVPGLSDVFVLGDLAAASDEKGAPLPGLAQVAHQQGQYLAKSLLGRLRHGTKPEPFRFRSRGNLAVIGRHSAVVQWDSVKLKGLSAWMVWSIAHIYLLIGFQNRVVVALRWLWAYAVKARGARLIGERMPDPDDEFEVSEPSRNPPAPPEEAVQPAVAPPPTGHSRILT